MKYLKIKNSVKPEELLAYGFEKGTEHLWGRSIDYLYYKNKEMGTRPSILLQIQVTPEEPKYLIIDYKMNGSWISRGVPAIIKDLIDDQLVEEVDLNF